MAQRSIRDFGGRHDAPFPKRRRSTSNDTSPGSTPDNSAVETLNEGSPKRKSCAILGNESAQKKSKPTFYIVEPQPEPSVLISQPGSSTSTIQSGASLPRESQVEDHYENDLGRWVGRSFQMTEEDKKNMLRNCWTPPENYDFNKDVNSAERKFIRSWLQMYSPWLAYSKKMKGGLCKFCVLFPPPTGTVKGVLGSFIVTAFKRYKTLHESCKNHASSHWHKVAVNAAKSFTDKVPVDVQLISGHKKLIEANKKVLQSIIATVMFCGTHHSALRGKDEQGGGVFKDLIHFRIDEDEELKRHLDNVKKNATYMSPQIQNEIIGLCGDVIKDDIIKDVKNAYAYSVLADETADISGKEQLSIGLRFFDDGIMGIREEFAGFVELSALDANTIATAIDQFLEKEGLDPEKCVGQGYDGCSTMAGKYGGVQSVLRKKYKKAMFFHCASHKLNLVVHDLNSVSEIRNTFSTIKDIIRFFRDSVLRRKYAPNLPLLCETRWTQKYKSIATFSENFVSILEGLEKLSQEGNGNTRKEAFQLHSAATKPQFIVAVQLIAKYSAFLEPTVNALQSKSLDLIQCSRHVKRILGIVETHRNDADLITLDILETANMTAEKMGIELTLPRVVGRQHHRCNHPASNSTEYWKRSLVIPYLDSLLSSLNQRFSEEHSPAFSLSTLHPFIMLGMSALEFKMKSKEFADFYKLQDFDSEAELWYSMWKEKRLNIDQLKQLDMIDLIKEAETFYPATKKALLICVTQPCTTCTVERSFSTLRRVKTWLRSTMTGEHLNGLCLLSVHKKTAVKKRKIFEKEVLDRFAAYPRKLVFV